MVIIKQKSCIACRKLRTDCLCTPSIHIPVYPILLDCGIVGFIFLGRSATSQRQSTGISAQVNYVARQYLLLESQCRALELDFLIPSIFQLHANAR